MLNKGMRCSLLLLLLLLAADQFAQADPVPKIVMPELFLGGNGSYGSPARAVSFNFRACATVGPMD